MTYEMLRQFADSWGLLYLFVLFVGAIFFTYRPGSKKSAQQAAKSILEENEDAEGGVSRDQGAAKSVLVKGKDGE